jgi:hypothetical protein
MYIAVAASTEATLADFVISQLGMTSHNDCEMVAIVNATCSLPIAFPMAIKRRNCGDST